MNEQSSPFLQLSRSLLPFLRSKPFLTVVRCHGLPEEKHSRVQNRSWVARRRAAHAHQPAPQTQTDHKDTFEFGGKLFWWINYFVCTSKENRLKKKKNQCSLLQQINRWSGNTRAKWDSLNTAFPQSSHSTPEPLCLRRMSSCADITAAHKSFSVVTYTQDMPPPSRPKSEAGKLARTLRKF